MAMVPQSAEAFVSNMKELVASGAISEERVKDACRRILRAKIRAGRIDNPNGPAAYVGITKNIGSAEHRQLAREAVQKSLVILKNKKVLPLKTTDKNKTDVLLSVTQEDIKQFGIIPEILGRLPILCPLRDLTVPDLVDILTKPKNALVTQYKELFKMDGSTLEITEEALKKIATLALQKGTGARALRTVLEETLAPVMFDLPENPAAVKVTLAAVSDNPEEDKLTIIKEPLEGACGAP